MLSPAYVVWIFVGQGGGGGDRKSFYLYSSAGDASMCLGLMASTKLCLKMFDEEGKTVGSHRKNFKPESEAFY